MVKYLFIIGALMLAPNVLKASNGFSCDMLKKHSSAKKHRKHSSAKKHREHSHRKYVKSVKKMSYKADSDTSEKNRKRASFKKSNFFTRTFKQAAAKIFKMVYSFFLFNRETERLALKG